MDKDAVGKYLNEFVSLVDGRNALIPTKTKVADDELNMHVPAIEAILDEIMPGWRAGADPSPTLLRGRDPWGRLRVMALRAIGQIQRLPDIDRLLGDTAPRLMASALHAWVWPAAKPLWVGGSFGLSSQQAFSSVLLHTQEKLNIFSIVDGNFFDHVFAPVYEEGFVRLLVFDDVHGKVAQVRQNAARLLGNSLHAQYSDKTITQRLSGLSSNEALEELAVVSRLARFVDEGQL